MILTSRPRLTDQMPAWPQVEFGHIFGYFIKRPGVFTQEELLDWQAYNFFQSGFARTVSTWTVNAYIPGSPFS